MNLFVFLLMWQSSGMSLGVLSVFPLHVLIAYGAKLNSLINSNHEWWRFVTPMFIHVNLLHLLVNMYSLWIIGPYVEKLYGGARFVVFWVLTGIAGVVASYLTVVGPETPMGALGRFLLKTQDEPSAGASGALFGLVGVLFVFGIKFRRELPEGFKRAFGTGLLPMIGLNLFIGYMGRGFIDNAAHMGGLVAGAALALVVDFRRPGESSRVASVWQVLRALALAIVVVSFVQVARHFRDAPAPPVASEQQGAPVATAENFIAYAQTINEAQEALYLAVYNGDTARVDTATAHLNKAPYLDQQAHELAERIRNLLLETKQANANAETEQQKHERLSKAFLTWRKDYNEWLKTVGRTYGGLIEVK
jgi:membrane associated rhomboid family serine protease